MKTKFLLSALLMLFFLNSVNAQSHKVGQANYNCKLNKKGWFFNSEKLSCPACEATDKKEKAAKAAEDKRRSDVAVAKANADKLAAEKLKIQKEEEKRIKDKEIADKILNDKLTQKNKQIAATGSIKSNIKGTSDNIDLANIECFTDNKRKIYGFKVDNKETLTFPFENGSKSDISRINGTNLFELGIWDSENKYYGRPSYYYILDHTGKKISIKGINKFNYVQINSESNTIFLFETISEEKTEKNRNADNRSIGKFHTNKESLMADYESNQGTSHYFASSLYINYDTRYTIDFKGTLLEKTSGYTFRR